MEIRRLSQAEHGKTRALYEEVFAEDSRAFVDYYYTEKVKDNLIYVVEEDGDIKAMLHLNPYSMYVNGTIQNLHYIVAVATRAAYRKRGYMTGLIRIALLDMYRNNEVFTYLMPAAESIYLPHDFRTVYKQEIRYELSEMVINREPGVLAFPVNEADCSMLADYANGYLSENYQVFAWRDENYYRRMQKEYGADGGTIMIYRKEGQILDCRIRTSDTGRDAATIMARIVDVERMLMSVRLKSLTVVCFHVTDAYIPENNRCIVLTGTEHSGIMLMDAKPENSEGTINIAVLTELIFGVKTAEEACGLKGVVMSQRMKQELSKIIPLSRICINEMV